MTHEMTTTTINPGESTPNTIRPEVPTTTPSTQPEVKPVMSEGAMSPILPDVEPVEAPSEDTIASLNDQEGQAVEDKWNELGPNSTGAGSAEVAADREKIGLNG